MEKAQFHTLVVLQVKVLYCLFAALGLSVIAVLDLIESTNVYAAVAAGFSVLLLLYAVYLLMRGHKRASPYPEWALVFLLCLFTLFGMQQTDQATHWIYFVPGYVYFLFPFHVATYVALVYSTALFLLIVQEYDSYLRLQILFTYAACYLFAVMYAMLNERNNRGLIEIINTDPVTQVYNEYQLQLDLNKEMTRADRQSSELILVGVAIPPRWHTLKAEDYEQRLSFFGKKLKRCLRKYDTCYRLNSDNFIILMPHSSSDDAERLQEDLLDDLAGSERFEGLTQVKVVQDVYLPEDDIPSMIKRIQEVLSNVQ